MSSAQGKHPDLQDSIQKKPVPTTVVVLTAPKKNKSLRCAQIRMTAVLNPSHGRAQAWRLSILVSDNWSCRFPVFREREKKSTSRNSPSVGGENPQEVSPCDPGDHGESSWGATDEKNELVLILTSISFIVGLDFNVRAHIIPNA